jgi:hypothetical protein
MAREQFSRLQSGDASFGLLGAFARYGVERRLAWDYATERVLDEGEDDIAGLEEEGPARLAAATLRRQRLVRGPHIVRREEEPRGWTLWVETEPDGLSLRVGGRYLALDEGPVTLKGAWPQDAALVDPSGQVWPMGEAAWSAASSM